MCAYISEVQAHTHTIHFRFWNCEQIIIVIMVRMIQKFALARFGQCYSVTDGDLLASVLSIHRMGITYEFRTWLAMDHFWFPLVQLSQSASFVFFLVSLALIFDWHIHFDDSERNLCMHDDFHKKETHIFTQEPMVAAAAAAALNHPTDRPTDRPKTKWPANQQGTIAETK